MTTFQLGQLTVSPEGIGVASGAEPEPVRGEEALFEHVRHDALGRYRPLTGARTLRAGWFASADDRFPVEAAIEVVYPLALTHQRQFADGTLRVVGIDDVLRRQSGRYEDTSSLDAANRRRATQLVCGECVRRPVWDGAACGPRDIPCPEPCSVLVAFCREAALWQHEPPAPVPEDPAVPWAAFDVPGNELRERYLRLPPENL